MLCPSKYRESGRDSEIAPTVGENSDSRLLSPNGMRELQGMP